VLSPAVATVAVLLFLVAGNLLSVIVDAESGGGDVDAVARELLLVAPDGYRGGRPAVHVDGARLGSFRAVVSFDSVSHDRGGLKRAREVTVLVDRDGSRPPALVTLGSFEDFARAEVLAASFRRACPVAASTGPITGGPAPTAAMVVMVVLIFGLPLATLPVLAHAGDAPTLAVCLLRAAALVAANVALLRAGNGWNRRVLARWSQARVAAAVAVVAGAGG